MLYSNEQPTNTVVTDGHTGTVFVSNTSILYAGADPFLWSVNAYVQMIKEPTVQWFVTLHIIAQGGNKQKTFRSGTVCVAANSIVPFPFPISPGEPILGNSYGMRSIAIQFNDGQAIHPNAIGIRLTVGSKEIPVIEIVNTEITPTWIIGAREIVLTDPPLMELAPKIDTQVDEQSIVG